MRDEEHRQQARLFAWAGREAARRPELGLLFAIPNGGARSAVTGARLKEEGVRRGVPDMMLPVARGEFHGLFIELKADAKARSTKEQALWLTELTERGYRALVCHGAGEAQAALLEYLSLPSRLGR